MSIKRRHFLSAVLVPAFSPMAAVMAAEQTAGILNYSGADDPKAFQKFLVQHSKNAVMVNVFNAVWCPPCKILLKQLDSIGKEPGVTIKIVGLDVGPMDFEKGPYENILKAHGVRVIPQCEVWSQGNIYYKEAGPIDDLPKITEFLRNMTSAVNGYIPGMPRP